MCLSVDRFTAAVAASHLHRVKRQHPQCCLHWRLPPRCSLLFLVQGARWCSGCSFFLNLSPASIKPPSCLPHKLMRRSLPTAEQPHPGGGSRPDQRGSLRRGLDRLGCFEGRCFHRVENLHSSTFLLRLNNSPAVFSSVSCLFVSLLLMDAFRSQPLSSMLFALITILNSLFYSGLD